MLKMINSNKINKNNKNILNNNKKLIKKLSIINKILINY